MAQKINIADLMVETYSDKKLKALSDMIVDAQDVFGLGSAAALAAMASASLGERAVHISGVNDDDMRRAEKDFETLRTYFVHLVDEENKAKKPLEKMLKNPDTPENELDAGYRTACSVIDEVFYMSIRVVAETLAPMADKITADAAPFASAAVHCAECAMDIVRIQKAFYASKMPEPVFARTTLREPEIAIESNAELFNSLIKKFEDKIKE